MEAECRVKRGQGMVVVEDSSEGELDVGGPSVKLGPPSGKRSRAFVTDLEVAAGLHSSHMRLVRRGQVGRQNFPLKLLARSVDKSTLHRYP